MVKKYFPAALLCILVFSCITPPRIPDDVLPKEKMVQMIADIHMVESRVGQLSLRSMDSAYVLEKVWEEKVYKKYNTDSATYKRSFRFYSENPEYMEEIYNAVTDSLIAWEKRISNENTGTQPPVAPPDTVKHITRHPLHPVR
jgi:hypothetical protein